MRFWRTMCLEVAGAVRSVRYDLGLLTSRRGRPTRRLVIAVGVLTALAAAGVGTAVAVVDSLTAHPTDRAATGGGSGIPDDSDGVSLSDASAEAGVSPPAATPVAPDASGTASPSPSVSPSRTGPTRTTPPVPTPKSPTPSGSPSNSPSGSPSGSYSPSSASPDRTP